MNITIEPAYEDIGIVRRLFSEYVALLGLNLDYQDFEGERLSLPGKYAPPDGRLYLARCDGEPAGCGALRRFDEERCEMKRLFVRPSFRGLDIGRMLAQRLIEDATSLGYTSMLLDTLPDMRTALALYKTLGFEERGPYYDNPCPEAVYLEKRLKTPSS